MSVGSKIADKSRVGIILMILAVFSLSCMSLCAKLIGGSYNPVQVTFFRNLIAVFFIVPFVLRSGGYSALYTSRPKSHFLRALAGVIGNTCFFYAYQHLPIADVMVLSQSVPLCVTIFAIPILKERVGWRRTSAVLIGFFGVIIALNPAGTISFVSLIALGGAVMWAFTILLVRDLGRTDHPYVTAFYYMLIGTLISGIFLPLFWTPLSSDVILLFLALGLAGALGQMLMSFALQLAESSVISPFNYTAIIWGICFDYSIWGLFPNSQILVGATIICGAGLYIFHRETQT